LATRVSYFPVFGDAIDPPDILPGFINHLAPGFVETEIVALATGGGI
jgi:hypothetical protein